MNNVIKCPKGSEFLLSYYNDALLNYNNCQNINSKVTANLLYNNIVKFNYVKYIQKLSHLERWNEVEPFYEGGVVFPSDWFVMHWCSAWFSNKTLVKDSSLFKLYKEYDII